MNFSRIKIQYICKAINFIFLFSFYQIACQNTKNNIGKLSNNQSCDSLNVAPFHGTIFIDPNIVTPEDYSTFINLSYNGRAERIMFDRRVADWITSTPYLFPANYDDSLQIEIQVNPEFGDLASAK